MSCCVSFPSRRMSTTSSDHPRATSTAKRPTVTLAMFRGMAVPRSDTNRREHLRWQLEFLDASIARYDDGHESEALRIAVVARVLLYDTGRSKSLLTQLGVRTATRLTTTMPTPEQADNDWGILVIEMPTDREWRLRAPVDRHGWTDRTLPPDEWWNEPILRAGDNRYTRGEIIKDVANTDGGAHVDPELREAYDHLWRSGLRGATASHGIVVRGPAWELMRQIGYEIQVTAARELLGEAPAPRVRKPPPGGPSGIVSAIYGGIGYPEPSSSATASDEGA